MLEQYRQGDVLLTRVEALPEGEATEPVPATGGRLVLAEGEATGHTHSVRAAGAELLEGGRGRRWLRVSGAPVTLAHPEHNPIVLRTGLYEVTRQREYVPGTWRGVAD